MRRAVIYETASGVRPFEDDLEGLADARGRQKIADRVLRAMAGNLGDHRSVGGGVIELRIDFGPGYRVYAGLHGETLIILLCAGDKGSQNADIRRAVRYWAEYRGRNP